jgi:hypothetical protein
VGSKEFRPDAAEKTAFASSCQAGPADYYFYFFYCLRYPSSGNNPYFVSTMMRRKSNLFHQAFILFLAIGNPLISASQDNHSLKYSDVRNGTFYYIDTKSGKQETFVRKGALQKEMIPKERETILWDVVWLTDSTYSLKYESGAENHSATDLKFLGKHVIVTQIVKVTEDYFTFRTAFDKMSNPTILNDTLWIKQRQSIGGKSVTNPNADSLWAGKVRTMDSLEATYATLYVFRPGKALNCLKNYDLVINGVPACVISNGCRRVLKLRKAGSYRISAKVDGPEQVVTIDAKPGESYYLQCMITWGLTSHPVLTLLDKVAGEGAFKTAEKDNLWHKD